MAPRTRGAAKTAPETTKKAAAPQATTAEAAVTPAAATPEAATPEVTTREDAATQTATPEITTAAASEEAYSPAQALPPLPGEKPSAVFNSLLRLPAVRRPELRPACGVINLTRMGNREAILAQSVGAPAPSPCGLCAKQGGPWTSCVVVGRFLHGSCANCH
jgi:hypothetical protein